jgi:isopentenyl diphosphate isomerase/L-lactate dehydrogenase-like FMN-dependent dehydrogenase
MTHSSGCLSFVVGVEEKAGRKKGAGMRADLIERAAKAGFVTLVVTADLLARNRRERKIKARIRVPPNIGPRLVMQSALHPSWFIALLCNGLPRFLKLKLCIDHATMQNIAGPCHDYLSTVREH